MSAILSEQKNSDETLKIQEHKKASALIPVAPVVFSSTSPAVQRELSMQTGSANKDKKEWLKKRWEKIVINTPSKRLMSTVLVEPDLIDNALIDDNLDYFKLHYKEHYPKKLRKALATACLCGSETIANFLLKKLKQSFTDEKNEYLLAYASASQNEEWVKKIAMQMAGSGLKMPDTIYSLASNYELVDDVINIFNKSSANKP
jgi:hypothetical protein